VQFVYKSYRLEIGMLLIYWELGNSLIISGRRHNRETGAGREIEVSRLENWKWRFLRYLAFFHSILSPD